MTNGEPPLKIAFVIGCARSGTSILGELIGSHPGVEYRHEAHHIWAKAGEGEGGSHRFTAAHATPAVRRTIQKRFEAKNGAASLVVEKNPRSMLRIPFLRAVFPDAKIIHIVRDGRDVACSMMPGIGGTEWRHLKPPAWRELLRDETGVVRCAKAWRDVLEIALDDLQDTPHYSLKYEDLVAAPERVAGELLEYVGLEMHPAVLEYCGLVQDATADSYQPAKQQKWFRDDHARRVGRWRENLSADEIHSVERVLAPLLTRLGYEASLPVTPRR